jgi:hypothetical protein
MPPRPYATHSVWLRCKRVRPRNLRQKRMGHARSTTTDIYSTVCGSEELAFAKRFWQHVA